MALGLLGLALGGIGSLVGGSKAGKAQAKAAERAAEATTQAAQISADVQRQNYLDTARLLAPRSQAGDAATARMLQLMGLPVPKSLTSGAPYQAIFEGGGSGGAVGGGGIDANAYFQAYPDVKAAYENLGPKDLQYLQGQGYDPTAQGFVQYHYDQFGKAEGRKTGADISGTMTESGGASPYALDVGQPGDITELIKSTPGYQFRFNEGINAVDSSAANRGMLMSGSAIKRLRDFGDEYAAREYGNYWNRLAGIAGAGQQATGGIASTGAQTAGNLTSIYENQGRGLASSYQNQGAANAGIWQNIGTTAAGLGGAIYGRYG